MKLRLCGVVVVMCMGVLWGGFVSAEGRSDEEVRLRNERLSGVRVAQGLEEEEEDEVFDPLEFGNRLTFDMFMLSYYIVIHPIVGVYNGVVPSVIRDRVDDFAGFVRMPVTLVNDVLQGNVTGVQKTVVRTAKSVPTLGLYDWERDESPRRYEDYGQTLAVYGVPEGPYVAFPLAPTSRDVVMYVGQSILLDPLLYVVAAPLRFGLLGLRLTSLFSNIDRGMMTVYPSVDGYALSRDLFLRQRRKAVEMRGEDVKELERRGDDFELDIDEDIVEGLYEDEKTGG